MEHLTQRRFQLDGHVATRMGKHTMNVIEDMRLRDGYRYRP